MPYRIDYHKERGEFGGIKEAIEDAKQILYAESPVLIIYHAKGRKPKAIAKVEIKAIGVTMLKEAI